ncbi:Imm32 family immunity protein [Kribbella sp. NBC_00382]|uniref:Imm32 family immunity protein n=1 Tax=Kribbella sp. NBC_00382 TaxID=2975967 RepID=UPI003FA5993F
MHLLYASRTGEFELSGRRSEFAMLADLLKTGSGEIVLEPVADPRPYDGALERLVVRAAGELLVSLRAEPVSGVLEFVGGAKYLALLGENFESFAVESAGPGDNFHLEYYEGHFYLAADSVPLVVAMIG